MKMVSFTEFRENASSYLNDVEDGETIQISRRGKVIAESPPVASRLKLGKKTFEVDFRYPPI